MHSLFSLSETFQNIKTKVLFQRDGVDVTSHQFLADIKKLSENVSQFKHQRWALCYEDSYLFLVAFFAVLHSQRIPILLPNCQRGTLQSFAKEFDAILSENTDLNSHVLLDEDAQETIIEFQSQLSENQGIVLFTSGSTGEPKKVSRTLRALMNEIEILEQVFGAPMKNSSVYSTVSHQHIYGLIFYCLWPLCANRVINFPPLNYPENIEAVINLDRPITLVSSPALLSRMPNKITDAKNLVIFSSGNLLKQSDALWVYQTMGVIPIEVLGSTETGGVAFRQQSDFSKDCSWKALPMVNIQIDQASQCLKVTSPFFQCGDGYVMGDKAQINEDGTFQLLERADRVAKIEGKRVLLSEIEERLRQHRFIEEAYAVAMETNRQCVAVVAVLTPEGKSTLEIKGKRSLNLELTNNLSPYFERILLPKRFRYVDKMPVNTQGKIAIEAIKKIFEEVSVKFPQIMSQAQPDEKTVTLQLFVSHEIEYFKGHFPGFPILPGVVQLDWAILFAHQFFGVKKEKILNVEQIKFIKAILPERLVTLSLEFEANKLSFKYFHDDVVCSSGKIRVSE